MIGAKTKVGNNKLLKLNELIDWSEFRSILKGIHKNGINAKGGQKPYDHIKMLKTVLLKEWHSLSDREAEEALKVRLDFMLFTGFDLSSDTPDETTICRFRNELSRQGIDKIIFDKINHQLEIKGIKIGKSTGAIIDATIVESSARPKKIINIENDRNEETKELSISESADSDARWLKKGKKTFFGYKGFVATDSDDGFINLVKVESANVAEVNQLESLIPDLKAEWIFADKGYASTDNRALLKGRFKDGIMRKAARNRPLTLIQKFINKTISKRRYKVEQCFGTLKRIFSFSRASYMTKA